MAFACVTIPDFIVQAILRSEPALRARGVAIVDGAAPLLLVVAANAEACRAGIQLGMMKPDVEQFSSVEIRLRLPTQEAAAHAALLDLALSFSPRIEDTAADTVVLDLEGLSHLFGSSENIANRLSRRASEFGLDAQVAVASNPDAAILAARGFPGTTMIPPGKESERLGCLPIQSLAPPAEILETLERWGVRTLGAFAALPTAQLSERLGQEGVRLQELARGASRRSLVLAQAQSRGAAEYLVEVHGTERPEEQSDAQRETDVADAGDDKGLLAGVGSGLLAKVETDQQVRAETHAFPPHEHQGVVGGGDQQQHHEEEKVEVGKETVVAAFVLHVTHRVEMNQEGDDGHRHGHHQGQAVIVESKVGAESARFNPGEIVVKVGSGLGAQR